MKRIAFEGTISPRFHPTLGTAWRVQPDDPHTVLARLAQWKNKHVWCTVEPYSGAKTHPQLGYYWSTLVPIWAEEAGEDDTEAWHYELWRAWFPERETVSPLTGALVKERPRMRDATKEEMSAYIDRLGREAAIRGILIPEPREAK